MDVVFLAFSKLITYDVLLFFPTCEDNVSSIFKNTWPNARLEKTRETHEY